ncbi:class I SAM-dependent methyltransferase [Micromonospora marina]|uniref:class I SAM-dependent methyltransferase n=1 Tax=Micromonospora marina TaxID=307120 RepID=UPI003D748412
MANAVIGSDISSQLRKLRQEYPHIYSCIDLNRVADFGPEWSAPGRDTPRDDFGAEEAGGRGSSYITAQQSALTRERGIRTLVDLVQRKRTASSDIIVDLLGGDGLVQRVVSEGDPRPPVIVTCDASPFMVEAAWERGIPALLHRAEHCLFRTGAVGGVLLAYGSHHIAPAQRATVAAEAFRILQPGGIFVLHDFAVGTPVDTWFSKVVDVYSATGHDYVHFEPQEVDSLLASAGFADVEVGRMDDSFVVSAATAEEAELELGRYLVNMYGLVRLVDELGTPAAYRRAFELASGIFVYEDGQGELCSVRTDRAPGRPLWSTTMPRAALVGFGRKPAERNRPTAM